MEKLRMETADMTGQNIEKIGRLFPNVITESKDKDGKLKKTINFDLLKQLLSDDVLEGDEAYEFTWVGKKASIVEANKPIRKTLRPCKEESKNWDTTGNLYIEGDNLDVLKLLQESYLGKIKMIYIDPPYNTGNDFVYRDNFTRDKDEYNEEAGFYDESGDRLFRNTESNGRFHSDWCSMIYPRLVLARNLLTDDGSIFVSIDFNEFATLKKIMDEVFGEENFERQIIWRIGWLSGYKTTAPNFIRNHDVILFYSKNHKSMDFKKKYIMNSNFKSLVDKEPKITEMMASLGLSREQQKDLLEFINHGNRPERYPIEDTWNCNEYDDLNSIAIVSFSGEKVSKILGIDQDFKGQKSVQMLKRVLESTTADDDVIMDFFSGTASTAHAVIELNAEDGGNRKFIMVQLQEDCPKDSEAYKAGYKNICEIGKERIRRAGEKIKADAGILGQDLDIGFRVFKLDSTNMKDVYYAAKDYTQAQLNDLISNIKEDRTDMDLLFACLLEWGLPLSLAHKTEKIDGFDVHTINDGDLMACFADEVSESVIREIAKRQPLRAVFRDSSFGTSPEKINVEEIFKLMSPKTKVKVI